MSRVAEVVQSAPGGHERRIEAGSKNLPTGRPIGTSSGRFTNGGVTLATVKSSKPVLVGRWRIVESPDFDKDFLDLEGPAWVEIKGGGRGLGGDYQWGAVSGAFASWRTQGDETLFTFDGWDDGTPMNGAGSLRLEGKQLVFTMRIHDGDSYTFRCRRMPGRRVEGVRKR